MIVTAGGKMIILDDNSSSVSIVCNDNTYVRLTDGNGLSIVTIWISRLNRKQILIHG